MRIGVRPLDKKSRAKLVETILNCSIAAGKAGEAFRAARTALEDANRALADANAGIESARDDVAQAIVDHDIEHHVGVRPVKAAEPRRDPKSIDHQPSSASSRWE